MIDTNTITINEGQKNIQRLEDEIANSALRVSFSEENTKEDIDYLVISLVEIVNELRGNI